MADYSNEKISAYNDISDAGTTITFQKKVSGTYNARFDVETSAYAELDGAIDDLVVALVLKNVTGTFGSSGEIWIDQEKLYYTTLAGLNMSGITRGYNGTSASAHLDSVNILQESSYTNYTGVPAVVLEINEGQILSTVIEDTDKMFLVPAYSLRFVPEQHDLVTLGSITYNVFTVKTVAPSNDPILYKVFTRRVLLSE